MAEIKSIEKILKEKDKSMKLIMKQMQIEIKINEEIAKRGSNFAEKCKLDLKMVLAIC